MKRRLGRLALVLGLCASILAPAASSSAVEIAIPGLDGGNCDATVQDPYVYNGRIQARGVFDCNRNYGSITIHTCIQLLVPTLPERGLFVQGPTCGFKQKDFDSHVEATGRMPIQCVPGLYHASADGFTIKGQFPNQEYGPREFETSNVVLITCGIQTGTGAEEQQAQAPPADESSESSETPAEESAPAEEPAESEAPAEEPAESEAPAEESTEPESTEPEATPEESSEAGSTEPESSDPQPEESPQP